MLAHSRQSLNELILRFDSPLAAIVRKLIATQIENERRRAEEDALLQQVEISRLKEELNALLPRVTHTHLNSATSAAMVPYHNTAHHQQVAKQNDAGWFQLGFIGGWFGSGSASGDKAVNAIKKSAFLV